MALNYLPFQRRETVIVPPTKAARVQTGGFAVTNLARMATGGTKRAIVQDIIVHPHRDSQYDDAGLNIRMRIGVDGRNYMTGDLYDWRVFVDVPHAFKSMWDWSCGKKTPYRLYPGQRMTVLMTTMSAGRKGGTMPIAAQFNCMKVAHGSPIGTKEGEPMMLYAAYIPEQTASLTDLLVLDSPRLICPKDSPVDIYSVTIPTFLAFGKDTNIVYILDGNERPFWDSQQFDHILDPLAASCSFGFGGLKLDPDETVRVEFENGDDSVSTDTTMVVTYRGVLEVDDGR